MSEHVYKLIELTGSSKKGLQAAIENAIGKAAKSLRNISWFQVIDTRGHVTDGKIAYWQVTLKVGFTLED